MITALLALLLGTAVVAAVAAIGAESNRVGLIAALVVAVCVASAGVVAW